MLPAFDFLIISILYLLLVLLGDCLRLLGLVDLTHISVGLPRNLVALISALCLLLLILLYILGDQVFHVYLIEDLIHDHLDHTPHSRAGDPVQTKTDLEGQTEKCGHPAAWWCSWT